MTRETRKLIIILVLFLILEIPLFIFWSRVSRQEEPLPPETLPVTETTVPTTAATEPPTVPTVPETIPAETMETIPEITEPPKITIDAVPQFYQNDYPEEPYMTGTVATGGGSMTALAMVASYMTDSYVYPDEMADNLAHFIGGDYPRLEYGSELLQLSFRRMGNVDEALNAVKEGKIAIILLGGNSMFSWRDHQDHYIVVTGVNEDGTFRVLDTDAKNYENPTLAEFYEKGFSRGYFYTGYGAGWAYDKSQMPEEPFLYTPEAPPAESRYPGLELSAEDRQLLANLICMEAGGEPFEGQQAVAEVVLNRLASGRFGSTLRGIIYAPEQFPSVERLHKAKPDYSQYKAIDQALNGPYVLPEDVVFFAKFKVNTNVWGQIGSHWFCYSY